MSDSKDAPNSGGSSDSKGRGSGSSQSDKPKTVKPKTVKPKLVFPVSRNGEEKNSICPKKTD
ncbi:MAG: hypothetical protein AAFQ63_20225 [Cyanobacteria bacterium J06621_11]